jgi:thioredoxin 1
MTAEITDATFDAEVLGSDVPVLVDFWAQWCAPCHRLAPLLDQLSAEYEGRARIVKMDVDTNPETSRRYGIMSMPTLTMYRAGKPVSQQIGAQPVAKLRAQIDAAIMGG